MGNFNRNEQIISLINEGWDLESMSFALNIPMEEITKLKEQLEIRKFAKESIKNNQIERAIEKLSEYISMSEESIVEQTMLLKLKAYVEKTQVKEEDTKSIEDKKKEIGFDLNVDEILNELGLQIPKRKSSNMNKKQQIQEKQEKAKEIIEEEIEQEPIEEKRDYQKMIELYKSQIEQEEKELEGLYASSRESNRRELLSARLLNKRNLLAFAYSSAGLIDEARDELTSLIDNERSYTAYRQLIRLEKLQGNMDEARLWAYEGIDRFPDDIRLREQLISIAKQEKDNEEVIEQLRAIIRIAPNNQKHKRRLSEVER